MENNNEKYMMTYFCDKCGKVIETIYGDDEYFEYYNNVSKANDNIHVAITPKAEIGCSIIYTHKDDLCDNCKEELSNKIKEYLKELGFNIEETK